MMHTEPSSLHSKENLLMQGAEENSPLVLEFEEAHGMLTV